MPLRWSVGASGYAETKSRSMEVHTEQAVTVPDVAMLPEGVIVVRARLPRDPGELRGATIVLGDPDDNNKLHFHPSGASAPLVNGDVKIPSPSYGRKRLWVQSETGRRILYRDFDVTTEITYVDLAPIASEIGGTVTRKHDAVTGALVRLADPLDARTILASATTNERGQYLIRTFQSGDLYLYAIESGRDGTDSYATDRKLHTNEGSYNTADIELQRSGASIKVVDAASDVPVRAKIEEEIEFHNGGTRVGTALTDSTGTLELTGFPDGVAHLHVQASGYRAKAVDVPLAVDAPESIVKLDRSGSIKGRVMDVSGAPIAGAKISGGYRDELAVQGVFETTTDQNGSFRFDSAPEIATTFYIAAPHHALGITTFQSDHDNIVTLYPPSRSVVFLMPDNAPPKTGYFIAAAPVSGEFIPQGALVDLAEVNGLNGFQLIGIARDGSIVLPQFLQPGSYGLYIAMRGHDSHAYQRVGSVSLPVARNVVLAFKTR
jgi:hypothetical protein